MMLDVNLVSSIGPQGRCFNLYYDAATDEEDDLPDCLSWTKTFKESAAAESSSSSRSRRPPRPHGGNSSSSGAARSRRGRPNGDGHHHHHRPHHTSSSSRSSRQRSSSDASYSSRSRQRDNGDSSSRYRGRRTRSSSSVSSTSTTIHTSNRSPPRSSSSNSSRGSGMRPPPGPSSSESRSAARRRRPTSAERRYREQKRAAEAEAKLKEETQRRMQTMFFTAMRLKSIAKRFMVKPEEKNRAAVKIQSVVRRYLTKAKSTRAEEKRKAKERRRAQKLKAATTIYYAVVRYMARAKERRAEEKRKAKAKRRAQKLNAIVTIQSVIRRFLVNTEEERIQAKNDAATTIQTIYRGYMAKTITKRAEEKRQAEQKWAEQKALAIMKVKRTVRKYMFSVKFMTKLEEKVDHDLKVSQQNEIDSIKAKIEEINRQTAEEISDMRQSMDSEKEHMQEEHQKKITSLSTEDVLDSFDEEMRILDEQEANKKEIAKLEKQAKDLKASIEETQEMIATINEENADLQQANGEIRQMFDTLNAFARQKFEDKKKLVAAQKKYSKELLPKVKSDISQGTKAGISETKVKDLYRDYMYKVLQGVQASDRYDQILYDDTMYIIRECETSLGAEVRDFNGSLDYMNDAEDREEAMDTFQEEMNGGNWNDSQDWNTLGASQSSESNYFGESKSWGQSGSNFSSSTDTWGDSWGQSRSASSNNASDGIDDWTEDRDFGKSMVFDEVTKNADRGKNLSQFFGATQSLSDSDRFDDSEQGDSEKVWDGNEGGKVNLSSAGVNWDALSAWTDD